MYIVIGIVIVVLLLAFPKLRCIVCNPIKTLKYMLIDMCYYFRHRHYNRAPYGALTGYCGLFGSGKTLSMTHHIVHLYRRYHGKLVWCPERKKFVKQRVLILSNVVLRSIPYTLLHSLSQVVEYTKVVKDMDTANDCQSVLYVIIDEASVQLNSRKFRENIDASFLNSLLTCRHYRVSLFYTSQRFMHIDALMRQVTQGVYQCSKLWRLQGLSLYDAWELEQSQNAKLVKPIRRSAWFVTNSDYGNYDTYACVGNLTKAVDEGSMMTAEEILALQAVNAPAPEAVTMPSKRSMRNRGVKRK